MAGTTTTGTYEEEEFYQRRHGLHSPFALLQYVAFFAYVVFILSFYLFQMPLLIQNDVIGSDGLGLTYFLGILAAWIPVNIGSYIWAAVAPVHDPGLDEGSRAYRDIVHPPAGKTTCIECQAFVSLNSKHCWICDKCVVGFDHHCKWLNHCVGARNYKIFVFFLSNTTLLIVCQTVLAFYFLFGVAADGHHFERLVFQVFGPSVHRGGVYGFLMFSLVLEVCSLLPLMHLCALHIFLRSSGQTTYQWILKNREIEHKQRMERIELGMPADENPWCHDFAVWRWKNMMGISSPGAPAEGRHYRAKDAHSRTSSMSEGPVSVLATPRESIAASASPNLILPEEYPEEYEVQPRDSGATKGVAPSGSRVSQLWGGADDGVRELPRPHRNEQQTTATLGEADVFHPPAYSPTTLSAGTGSGTGGEDGLVLQGVASPTITFNPPGMDGTQTASLEGGPRSFTDEGFTLHTLNPSERGEAEELLELATPNGSSISGYHHQLPTILIAAAGSSALIEENTALESGTTGTMAERQTSTDSAGVAPPAPGDPSIGSTTGAGEGGGTPARGSSPSHPGYPRSSLPNAVESPNGPIGIHEKRSS